MTTEQEEFWKGYFGDEYIQRNSNNNLGSQLNLFGKIFSKTVNVGSVYEIGTNIGRNLDSIKLLKENISCNGVEINKDASDIAISKGHGVENNSIFETNESRKFDFVLQAAFLYI